MADETEPLPDRANGDRDRASGKFLKGCKGGPGNPEGRRIAKLRSALLNAVTEEDIAEIMQKMVGLAKNGDVQAAKIVLERTIGKVDQGIAISGDSDDIVSALYAIHPSFGGRKAEDSSG